MPTIVKTDHENFVRDMNSTAVLNTDKIAYDSYKKHRERLIQANTDVENLKQEVTEIKHALNTIMNLLINK